MYAAEDGGSLHVVLPACACRLPEDQCVRRQTTSVANTTTITLIPSNEHSNMQPLNGSFQGYSTQILGPYLRVCHLNIEGISSLKNDKGLVFGNISDKK